MATMTAISNFMPLVLPYAPAVPFPVAEQMIRLAAVEFCERTRCWRHILTRHVDAFNGGCGQPQIRILPPYATIFEFEFAYFNGEALTPTQFSDVDVRSEEQGGPEIGVPAHITQTEPNTVMLLPLPEASGSLQLSLFLKPVSTDEWSGGTYDFEDDDDLNVLPEFLLTQQGEILSHGALARILALPGQSFSDPREAARRAALFAQGLDSRFRTNLRGQQRAPTRTKPHSF